MLYSTLPSALVALIVFFMAGRGAAVGDGGLPPKAIEIMENLLSMFKFNVILVIPFLIVLVCAFLQKPPMPTMLGASFVAILLGVFYQGFTLKNGFTCAVSGFNASMTGGEAIPEVATLLNRGGMSSMWSITLIIFCGYSYAAILFKAKFLETALNPLISNVKSVPSLVGLTLLTDLLILCCAGTSHVAHIMVGDMYKKAYIDRGISLNVLSRSMEDIGTMMAPLIPWGTSGIFYLTTLGVAAYGSGGYAVWALNTYMNPVFAMILAFTGIGIFHMTAEEQKAEQEKYERDIESI